MEKLIQVQLRPGHEKKFRQGQSWIFSHDISDPPRELRDGNLIEVRTAKNEFIGRGYWNSESKILGRILSFDSRENDLLEMPFFVRRLKNAFLQRKRDGFRGSFRLIFGEGDYFPGVVIDYYVTKYSGSEDLNQVFVIQTSTLGIERSFQRHAFGWETIIKEFVKELKELHMDGEDRALFTPIPLEKTAVVLRNDIGSRKHEGLDEEPPRILFAPRDLDVSQSKIALNNLSSNEGLVWMEADLLKGQKTGFFLDQTRNIERLLLTLRKRKIESPIRVVDLCCYLGHWSTQMAQYFSTCGIKAEFYLVDVSDKALQMAARNVEAYGMTAIMQKRDVLKDMSDLIEKKFDIVICDPPAFIKSKKDLATGQPAYTKLNRSAVDMTKPGGLMVTCSCSGLLTDELFKQVILKSQESFSPQWRMLDEGGLPTDHPRHMGFTEGAYLKMYLFEKHLAQKPV